MNQVNLSNAADIDAKTASVLQQTVQLKQPKIKKQTFGQRLADSMAAKVGSWMFIGVQSTILVGWIGANSLPGVPHWDQSPFILLNLVFSFASAYTAPVVLMSQNRQSEEDRESAAQNHQVNVLAAQNVALLHEKLDDLRSRQLLELAELLKQQAPSELKLVTLPAQTYSVAEGNHADSTAVSTNDRPLETVFSQLPVRDRTTPAVDALQLRERLNRDKSLSQTSYQQFLNQRQAAAIEVKVTTDSEPQVSRSNAQ